MKNALFILFLLISTAAISQSQLDSLRVRTSLTVAGYRATGISNDTLLSSQSATKLLTEWAAKKLMELRLATKLNYYDTALLLATKSNLNSYATLSYVNTQFATTSSTNTALNLKADKSTTLTINGVTQDISTSRSWTVSGGIGGTISANQIAFGSGTNTIAGNNNFLIDASNRFLVGNPINDNTTRFQVNGGIKSGNNTQNILMIASSSGGFIEAYSDNNMTSKLNININWNGGRVGIGSLSNNAAFANTNNNFIIGNPTGLGGIEFWTNNANQNFLFNSSSGDNFIVRRSTSNVNNGVGTFYNLLNNSSVSVGYASFFAGIESNSAGNHNGFFSLQTATNGTLTEKVRVNSSGNLILQNGNLIFNGVGTKPIYATGTNAAAGTATLVNGTVTVNTTAVATNSQIRIWYRSGTALSTTSSVLVATSIINNTSFTVTAYQVGTATINTADNNQIEYLINN